MRILRLSSLIFLLLCFNLNAQEIIVSYEKETLPVLNEELRKLKETSDDIQKAWPIGSIYMSVLSTDPSELLGFGTWEAWGAGKVIVGLDSGDVDFDASEETGGVKEVTLTSAQSGLVAHTHGLTMRNSNGAGSLIQESGDSGGSGAQVTGSVTGGAADAVSAHTNVQPYIVAYLWKRTE